MQRSIKYYLLTVLFVLSGTVIYWGNLALVLPSNLPANLITFSLFVDLAVWVPALFYFLMYRTGIASAVWIKPLIMAGIACALYVLPSSPLNDQLRAYYPIVVSMVAAIAVTVFGTRLCESLKRTKHLSGESKIDVIAESTFGESKVADLIRLEWVSFYYALFGWRQPTPPTVNTQFSYHVKSGARGLIFGVTVFHLPSLVFTHVVLHQMSPTIAAVMTVMHLYSMYFFIAQANAMQHRYMVITDSDIVVRCGLLFENKIPLSDIEHIERAHAADAEKRKGRVHIALFGYTNVKITLKETRPVNVMAGLHKSANELILGMDKPYPFIHAVNDSIQKSQVK